MYRPHFCGILRRGLSLLAGFASLLGGPAGCTIDKLSVDRAKLDPWNKFDDSVIKESSTVLPKAAVPLIPKP